MALHPVVRVVPLQPHCFAFGGFEVQMIAAMESARTSGADIAPLDFWRQEADFDVLHLWGLQSHSYTMQWAKAAGKKTVLSALVYYPNWIFWLRHLASLAIGPARQERAMLANVDCMTVVNKAQARYVVGTMGLSEQKVVVIPNVVEEIFFKKKSSAKSFSFGIENYVLCVGNVCPRKNQLMLARACRKLGVSLLLVGPVLTGEEDYGHAVAAAVDSNSNFCWIKGLPPSSFELAAAYQGASVFALPSHMEHQPISALEAAASGNPLVLADRSYAKQEFYEHASLADPCSVDAIASALRKALDRPAAFCPRLSVIEDCRREKVGAAYLAIYQRLFK